MSKKRNYKVYVHINKINGKRYYGITKQKVEKRWNYGYGYRGNDYFTKAINKYGWDNFEHIVIVRGLTEEEAKWLEIELIREWDTTNRGKGYNITKGGDSNPTDNEETRKKIGESNKGREVSEETRRKMSENLKGKSLSEEHRKKISKAMKGRTLSEEHRKKISKAMKGRKGKYHPNYGKTLSKETRKKISEANKGREVSEETRRKISEANKGKQTGKDSPRAIKIYCVELDNYFDTVEEAGKYVGCSNTNISSVLRGKSKTAKGYHWLYADEVNEENINNVLSEEYNKCIVNHPSATKVYCVELDMYFNTITEASKYVGCNNISKVLRGNNKTCGGYHWLYADEVNEENINNVLSKGKGKLTKVYCVELDMYFDTVTEASKYVGRSGTSIRKVLNGERKTCGGYHWLYAEDVEKLTS